MLKLEGLKALIVGQRGLCPMFVIAAALAVAGCGGGGGGGSPPPAATLPSITTQPVNTAVSDGSTATLSVAATGTAPLAYQWRRNQIDVGGANGASYTTPALTLADNGVAYSVLVSNAAGSVTSNPATVTVNGAAPTITAQPQVATVADGAMVTLSVTATGSLPLAYQWRRNGTDLAGFTGTSYSFTAFLGDNGAVFSVRVTNSFGTRESNPVTLTVNALAPMITVQPVNQATVTGAAATFSVTATGGGLSYRWQASGDGGTTWTDIAGATSTTYSIVRVGLSDIGMRFRIAVTNGAGTTISNAASLTVTPRLEFLAGTFGSIGYADGPVAAARFSIPRSVVTDTGGTTYVSDTGNHTIRRISPAGVVDTFAGTVGVAGFANGAVGIGQLNTPAGIALDAAGNLYVADRFNNAIRVITPAGQMSTLIGGPSATAFADLSDVAVTSTGEVYFVDRGRNVVLRAGAGGSFVVFAGDPNAIGSTDGVGTNARFLVPAGLAVGPGDTLYVADSFNHTIRAVTTPGAVVSTVAGVPGMRGYADGAAGTARFKIPRDLHVTPSGTIYVAEIGGHTIRRIEAGVVSTLAGSTDVAGSDDGPGAFARLRNPVGIGVDGAGNVLVGDTGNNTIRRVTSTPSVSTFAGAPPQIGALGGTGAAARFSAPQHLVANGTDLFVADSGNHVIWRVNQFGTVSLFAGLPGVVGSTNGVGNGALFNAPLGIAIDVDNNLYVTERDGCAVRKITPGAVVTTLAGGPLLCGDLDGAANVARLLQPAGIAVAPSGIVYFADAFSNKIKMISLTGQISTVAGDANGDAGTADGPPSAARFNNPYGMAIDGAGNLYVTDLFSHTIRRVVPSVGVTTVAGAALQPGAADGTGNAARFSSPTAIAIDARGNLVVSDVGSHTLRRVTPAGVVSTLVGQPFRGAVKLGDNGTLVGATGLAFRSDGAVAIVSEQAILVD